MVGTRDFGNFGWRFAGCCRRGLTRSTIYLPFNMKIIIKRINRAISISVLIVIYLLFVGIVYFFYKIFSLLTHKNKKTEWKAAKLSPDVTWESLSSPY